MNGWPCTCTVTMSSGRPMRIDRSHCPIHHAEAKLREHHLERSGLAVRAREQAAREHQRMRGYGGTG